MRLLPILFCIFCISTRATSQTVDTLLADKVQTTTTLEVIKNIPDKTFESVNARYQKLSDKLNEKSAQTLRNMQKQEDKIYKKLLVKDSLKAIELFADSKKEYDRLKQGVTEKVNTASTKLKEYIPGLDSMNTAFKFLQQKGLKMPDLSSDKLKQIEAAAKEVKELQGRLQQANNIQEFVRQRESVLKAALQNTAFAKDLLKLNKQVYYYQQQLAEYKSLLHDPNKMEVKALEMLNKLPAFQSFMQKNSMLASLFKLQNNHSAEGALTGIQTTSQIEQMIGERFSGSGVNSQQFMQQQMQTGQAQLQGIKDKLNQLGGGSSDMTMPDFKPDDQKTKTFLKRIEYGFNIQNESAKYLLPSISDLALTAGYRINDKSIIGVGASYKMGWGEGWNHIKLSSQGLGLRSYVDIKAKGDFWLSGGYELNYLQSFQKFQELYNVSAWQRSGLLGVTKKYRIGKRENNVQLLWDFLSYSQVPRSSPIKFRIGFKL